MKGGRWTDREADGHNRETNRQRSWTGWQKINRLKPREQSDRGERRGEGRNTRTVNIEKYTESVFQRRARREDK